MMTARELLESAINDSGQQVVKIFENLPPDSWDQKPAPEGMTIRAMAQHLCECYYAYSEMAQGRTYDWGSYAVEVTEPADLVALVLSLRSEAAKIALDGSDKAMKDSLEFLCLHDAYHIGQIALIRIRTEPNWDPYSIYGS